MANGARYVLAIDQGTTSSRAVLFDHDGVPAFASQEQLPNYYPSPGWAEQDPMELLATVQNTVAGVMAAANATAGDVASIGVTNQRETTVAWDRRTGKPLHNALVWLDLRTVGVAERLAAHGGLDRFRKVAGLPVSSYFSAVKILWLLENVPEVREALADGQCMFGTVDSWLTYHLTGGVDGGIHVTDVTNASRYMLMDLATLAWDEGICRELEIPISCLPEIRSNSEVLGHASSSWGAVSGVPLACSLGDQHAALLGHGCLTAGDVKGTYGTGCFIVMNTGSEMTPSTTGLLTTVGFRLGKDAPVVYALEGSVAIAGRGTQWLKDVKIISKYSEVDLLAATVPDTGGVTFVPVFSGFLAPRWLPEARAAIVGMSLYTTAAHICRAFLEGVAFQASDVMRAMLVDAGARELSTLRVDGGFTANGESMQLQADLLGRPLLRASNAESTALGAAFAAGLAVGFWRSLSDVRRIVDGAGGDLFEPKMDLAAREAAHERWRRAVAVSGSKL